MALNTSSLHPSSEATSKPQKQPQLPSRISQLDKIPHGEITERSSREYYFYWEANDLDDSATCSFHGQSDAELNGKGVREYVGWSWGEAVAVSFL